MSAPTTRPRKGSKSKRQNLWLDIDTFAVEIPSITPLWHSFIPSTISQIPDDVWDWIIATFFSACAVVSLITLFIGLHVGFVTMVFGLYLGVFGVCYGVYTGTCRVREGIESAVLSGKIPRLF